jgi:TctA family transporter
MSISNLLHEFVKALNTSNVVTALVGVFIAAIFGLIYTSSGPLLLALTLGGTQRPANDASP